MVLDCISNYTGPAYLNLDRLFITDFIFIIFLLLLIILIQVQVVTICDKLHFYKHFNIVFEKLYSTFHMVYGLYWVARQCHQLHVPERQLKKTTRRLHQQLTQTLPPSDEYIPALMTRLILICYTEPSPLFTPSTPQRIPAPQQDRAIIESEIGILHDLLISIEDRFLDSETPICQVQPLLGMTQKMYN